MRIAPIDIAHKTFGRKMMGLDADEVTDFLRDVADQMEEIIRERNALKEALREKELAIMDYRERDQTLKNTIETATKMSEQIRLDAEREAKLVLQDAHQKAELIVADARDSLKRIYSEINDLKRSRMQFDASLRSLLHAHLSMLDQSHSLIPDPQITVGSGRNFAAQQAPLQAESSGHSVQPANSRGHANANPNLQPAGAGFAGQQGGRAGVAGAPASGAQMDANQLARMPRPTNTLPK